jgi:hypothetical protein
MTMQVQTDKAATAIKNVVELVMPEPSDQGDGSPLGVRRRAGVY